MSDSTDGTDEPAVEPAGRRQPRARRATRSVTERQAAGKRRARKSRVVAKVIGASLLALAMGTAVSVVLVYNNWSGNLDHQDLSGQLGDDRPPAAETEELNILVMGSDTRDCQGCNIDGLTGDGERSDTTILLHLSADRKRAYGISVPRDTLVDRPTCYEEDGETEIPGQKNAIWNEAFSVGGPACTIRQFEQLTGIRIHNYLVIDFQGFKDMVNALDGVEVCIPEDINDAEHGITLEAGTRELKGDEALSYVRVRAVGNGTDPNRIRRQQAFMASMINKAVSAGMLARPDRMIGFVNALTDSITTDFNNPAEIADVGRSFQGIGLDKIQFVTTPWEYSTIDPNRVEWTPKVKELWKLVRDDQPLTDDFTDESISAADNVEGSSSPPGEATDPTETNSPGNGGRGGNEGLSQDAREDAGLCS